MSGWNEEEIQLTFWYSANCKKTDSFVVRIISMASLHKANERYMAKTDDSFPSYINTWVRDAPSLP